MAYGAVLTALADPTRRRIFEALRAKPMTVGELAKFQPVSRPAVSQHLKVLRSADLVTVEERGSRHLYLVKQEGLDELRRYLEGFWSHVMTAYGEEVKRRTKKTRRGR